MTALLPSHDLNEQSLTEADRQLVEEGGWKCVNGHPYCNRCASSLDLNEQSLERILGLTRFERKAPIRISPGRRWWK